MQMFSILLLFLTSLWSQAPERSLLPETPQVFRKSTSTNIDQISRSGQEEKIRIRYKKLLERKAPPVCKSLHDLFAGNKLPNHPSYRSEKQPKSTKFYLATIPEDQVCQYQTPIINYSNFQPQYNLTGVLLAIIHSIQILFCSFISFLGKVFAKIISLKTAFSSSFSQDNYEIMD